MQKIWELRNSQGTEERYLKKSLLLKILIEETDHKNEKRKRIKNYYEDLKSRKIQCQY